MRREPKPTPTGLLQIIGVKHYRRWYLPATLWFAGWLLSAMCFLLPAALWQEIFTVEGAAL